MWCRCWPLLALLGGCSGEGQIYFTDAGGGDDGSAGVADLAGTPPRDLAGGPPQDLASVTCAQIQCGAHATCDPKSLTCRCDQGYGGDPKAGCAMQTPCGACPQFSHCDTQSNTCACDPGYLLTNGACAVAPAGDPAARTPVEVCAVWKQGHVITDAMPYKAGAMQCDPGTFSRGGIDDALRRIDLFRWLGGLYPVVDDPVWNTKDQLCAVMESANGMLNHMPPMNWKCWSQDAYDAAASSNLAFGSGNAAGAIDLYMDDSGVGSLGHRRWVMSPPLNGVGVGFANGCNCLHVFGGGNMVPAAKWQAVPNQGPAPLAITGYGTWSFHAAGVDLTNATVSVLRVEDNMPLQVTVTPLPQGFGVNAVGWTHAWQAVAGMTYRVTVGGTALGSVTYDVKPVNCP